MREQIGLGPGAEEREQREAGRDDHPRLRRARPGAAPGDDPQRRQDADRPEHRRGGPHRDVIAAVRDGGERVATGAGQQHQREAHAGPDLVAHGGHQQRHAGRVPEHVEPVGVQRERGDRPPPLAGHHARRVRAAALEPRAALRAGAGDREEPDEQQRDDEAHDRERPRRGDLDLALRGVLAVVGRERVEGGVGVDGLHEHGPAVEPLQTAQQERLGLTPADVSDDSTHPEAPFVGPPTSG